MARLVRTIEPPCQVYYFPAFQQCPDRIGMAAPRPLDHWFETGLRAEQFLDLVTRIAAIGRGEELAKELGHCPGTSEVRYAPYRSCDPAPHLS